jgi:hypothetical protein
MAEIFKAKLVGVEGFEKTVVIKRILPFWSERRDFITMLVDEAKVLVHLNHPNIVQVYELGRVGETYFIAMEHVEGFDLRRLLDKLKGLHRPLPQDLAVSIILGTLKGLHYAHRRSLRDKGLLGIVHRDVSPQNILLSLEGEVKVTDFGIAKAVTQTHETQTGVLKGKYAYMSPEQAAGRDLDARSDIFSCGIVLFELLFGERLFSGKNDVEILDQVRRAELRCSREKLSGLYSGLEGVLRKALAKDRKDRYGDAEAMAKALESCLPQRRPAGPEQLAVFLKEVFPEEIAEPGVAEELTQLSEIKRRTVAQRSGREETVSLVEAKTLLVAPPRKVLRKVRWLPAVLGALWLVLAVSLTYYFVRYLSPKSHGGLVWGSLQEKFSRNTAAVPSPVTAEPSPSPRSSAPLPAKKPAPKFGSIQVNAVPWGRVVLSGYISGRETPFQQGQIPEGRYPIQVSNPVLNKTIQATAIIRSGRTTRCHADFEGKASLRCR